MILQPINDRIRSSLRLKQFQNTQQVVAWFKSRDSSRRASFTTYDVESFYPSITQQLVKKTLNWASKQTNITVTEQEAVLTACNNLLFTPDGTWIKTNSDIHDITMGSYCGAEICETVGLYMLSKLRDKNIDSIIYRDDGAIMTYNLPRANQRLVEVIKAVFMEEQLNITIEANVSVLNFLDVTLDITNAEYRPYHKENHTPIYVHAESNHPQSILKQIPLTVQRRISNLCSDSQVFEREKLFYEDALGRSGYTTKLTYTPSTTSRGKQRGRQVIWYNPPYCRSVKTRLGAAFLDIVTNSFPKSHPLNKILNRNTIKLSPSCMSNMKSIFSSQNKSKLSEPTDAAHDHSCNCNQVPCPLQDKCNAKDIVYKATISNTKAEHIYLGSTSNRFIRRYHVHKGSLSNRYSKNHTALSNKVWQLRDDGEDPKISFEIFKQSRSASTCENRCNLCLTEKRLIAGTAHPNFLNSRSEIFAACRHKVRWKVGRLL